MGCEVGFCFGGVDFGTCNGSRNNRLSRGRASNVGGPLSKAPREKLICAGDCESGTINLGGVWLGNISVDDSNFVLLIGNV